MSPAFFPCGCSRQKVRLGRCDVFDRDGALRAAKAAPSPLSAGGDGLSLEHIARRSGALEGETLADAIERLRLSMEE